MRQRPEQICFDGVDGPLGALRWPSLDGAPVVIALHGFTANAWHFGEVADHLAGAIDLIAVDLRGRGRSFGHPGPWGLRFHAADIARLVHQLDAPVTMVGHGMGATIALLTAEQYPGLAESMVLVDGGPPHALPRGVSIDDLLHASLIATLTRLRTVWPDRVSYTSMRATYPSFANEGGATLDRILLSDLVEVDSGFRVAINEDALLRECRELLVDPEVRALLAIRSVRTPILRATAGILGNTPPLISEQTMARFPQHDWWRVARTNHQSIVIGAGGAACVAEAVRRQCLPHDQRRGKSALSTTAETSPGTRGTPTSPSTTRNVLARSNSIPPHSVTSTPPTNVPTPTSSPSSVTNTPS
jgi:pimeloyl-ACP methyl ester carboxylesterase